METNWVVAFLPLVFSVIYYGFIILAIIFVWKFYKIIKNNSNTLMQIQLQIDKILEHLDDKK